MTNNFEIFVQGAKGPNYLVHSRMKKNHKLFADESQDHLEIVKKSIQDIINGKEPVLADSRKKEESILKKKSKEEMAEQAKVAEEEKTRKREEADKRKAELAAERDAADSKSAADANLAKQSAEKKEADERSKKKTREAEAARRKKKAAEQKATEHKDSAKAKAGTKAGQDSTQTASTTASLQSAEESVKSGSGEDIPDTTAPANAQAKDAVAIVHEEAAAKIEHKDADSEATSADKVSLPEGGTDKEVKILAAKGTPASTQAACQEELYRSECRVREEMAAQLRERETARVSARVRAQKEAQSSFFGFTCCRSSKLEDHSCEEGNIQLLSNDDMLILGDR